MILLNYTITIIITIISVLVIIFILFYFFRNKNKNKTDESDEEKIYNGLVYNKKCDNCGQFRISYYDRCYHCIHCGKKFSKNEFEKLQNKYQTKDTFVYPKEVLDREKNKLIFTNEYKNEFEKIFKISLEVYYENINTHPIKVIPSSILKNSDVSNFNIVVNIYKDFILVCDKNEDNNGTAFNKVIDPLVYCEKRFRSKNILKSCFLGEPCPDCNTFYKNTIFTFDDPQDGLTYIKPEDLIVTAENIRFLDGFIVEESQKHKSNHEEFEKHYGIPFEQFKKMQHQKYIEACYINRRSSDSNEISVISLYKGTNIFSVINDDNRDKFEKLLMNLDPDIDELKNFLYSDKDIFKVEISSDSYTGYLPNKKAGILDYAIADAVAGDVGILATAIDSENKQHPILTNHHLYIFLSTPTSDKKVLIIDDIDTGKGSSTHLGEVWKYFQRFR